MMAFVRWPCVYAAQRWLCAGANLRGIFIFECSLNVLPVSSDGYSRNGVMVGLGIPV